MFSLRVKTGMDVYHTFRLFRSSIYGKTHAKLRTFEFTSRLQSNFIFGPKPLFTVELEKIVL